MRIAIVDDERQDCATLSEMLAGRLSQTAFIDVYDSGNHFLDSEVHYDLVFLDIVMDGLDGIETARRLREWDMGCLIVFLTSSSEYAWDAFPVHPFDYLLKPIDKARLARVLDEAGCAANPVLERLKFIAIFSSNLDEFFMVRIAGLRQLVKMGQDLPDPAGNRPSEQLARMRKKLDRLLKRQHDCLMDEILPELGRRGVKLVKIGRAHV